MRATPVRPAELRLPAPLVLAILGAVAVVAVVLFMSVNVRGGWDFVLGLRARKLWGLGLVAYAIAVSTVLFQTVTGNRILTPAIMGFDHLFQLVQTAAVFALGSFAYATLDPRLRFAGDLVVMVTLALVLFHRVFGRWARDLHLLVLVGIVLGVLFRSLSTLMQRLIDPNEFVVLQDALFASFNAIDPTLLVTASVLLCVTTLLSARLLPRLDVLLLGRETAIGLGVDHRRTVLQTLAVVAVMVSVSTALVGPVLFFGLLVAHLAYLLVPDYRHRTVLPAAVLVAFIALVGGQTLLEHGLGYNSALSLIIEFFGGITFIYLLLRARRQT